MPYLDDVLNPYQSLTGDLTPDDTLTGLLSEDGLLQGALAISDVVGVTELTELTDVSITNPINNDVLTYNDVTEKWENMPAQGGGGGGTSDYEDLDNKPSINSVTLSGNKTTADLNISYNDLDDKPTIPTKLNQLSDVNYIQPYPKDYLRYDSIQNGWMPYGRDDRVEGLSNVLTDTYEVGQVLQLTSITGQHTWRNQKLDYSNIVNTPTIPAAQVNSDWNASSGVAEILNKPTLATVATSGSYNDLNDQPTIPDITTINISSEYTFTKVSGSWEIHSVSVYKTGNTYQALFALKGDGTSVAAGSDGCVYKMDTGDAPLLFSFFIAMIGTSFCLGFFNSGDSTWHFRPINSPVTLNANSRLNFSGVFIK